MNRWYVRWRRFLLPKTFRHMAKVHPRLLIRRADDGGGSVHWDGRELVRLQPLRALRGSCRGRSAYCLATGPSVKDLDLAFTRGVATFGVNGAVAKFAGTDLAPSHYVITDADFVAERLPLVEAAFRLRPHFFLSPAALSAVCELRPDLLADATVSLIETHFCRYGEPRLSRERIAALIEREPALVAANWRIGFSRDIEIGLFSAHTVLYYAIQIAHYMGFADVFLLGMDLGASGAQVRFYEQRGNARPSGMEADYEKFILPSFRVLQRVCAQVPDFRVWNLSPVSRLPADVMPRLTPDEAARRARP